MTEDRIIAYLLEELPKEELERFEEECFAEEDWPGQIEVAEGDLIDSYLRQELTPERRQRFERNYLTTEARKERVVMAAALLRHLDNLRTTSESSAASSLIKPSRIERLHDFWSGWAWPYRAAAVALTLSVIIGGVFWFYLSRQSKPQTFVTLVLDINMSSTRGGGLPSSRVSLPLNADALRLSLKLPADAPAGTNYRVTLENDSGDAKTLKIAGQDAQMVAVEIPAAELKHGQYAVKLFAVKADGTEQRIPGSYFFRIE